MDATELPEPYQWNVPRPRQPWLDHGLSCPAGDPYHQPHPTPWWSGESAFAQFGQKYLQPEGPFFHAVFPKRDAPLLKAGDMLTSPAERRTLPTHLNGALTDDGCIAYTNYDVHAVYLFTKKAPPGLLYYEVEPIGLLWPDPEQGIGRQWCAARARILAVHAPETEEFDLV